MESGTQLSAEFCRERQQRVVSLLADRGLDRAIFLRHEHVQYLTGFRPHKLMTGVVTVDVSGQCLAVTANCCPDFIVADHVETYEAQWCSTLRQEQLGAAARVFDQAVCTAGERIGIENSVFHRHFQLGPNAHIEDIEFAMWRLRRRKLPDELAMIRRAIACTDAMYARAKEIIQPGISELEVFSELHAAAVGSAGEALTDLGNDFQCNSPGGPARNRKCENGELYILDLGPAYRGFYADNCRTFAVDSADAEQQRAWQQIVDVLQMVEETVRPGVSCRELYLQAKSMLDAFEADSFFHHLGHGFGMYPHEAPHLNPNWDDVFEEGDTFTAEPGLYSANLRAGIRLEQNYRVTSDQLERLTSFPLEL